jgi:LPXTG-site transpeptidase (sortase) family protein
MQIRKVKNRKCLLTLIGIFFIVISFAIVFNKYFNNYKVKKIEEEKIEQFLEETVYEEVSQEEIIDEPVIEEENQPEKINYIAVLEIPKMNLKRGLVDRNSWRNNVNYNIQILNSSDMPEVENGNFILAAHSGNSVVSYFTNLKYMDKQDLVYLFYNGQKLTYKVVDMYDIEKTGKAKIVRNKDKNTLTLISCRNGTNYQIVVICELIEKEVM